MRAIFKREMRAYFASPVGYVVVAALLALYGFFYYQVMAIGSSSYITQVFSTMFMFSMMIMPIITMRSMSDDRKNKTDQALITAPVSVTGIVMGKFLAASACISSRTTLALRRPSRWAFSPPRSVGHSLWQLHRHAAVRRGYDLHRCVHFRPHHQPGHRGYRHVRHCHFPDVRRPDCVCALRQLHRHHPHMVSFTSRYDTFTQGIFSVSSLRVLHQRGGCVCVPDRPQGGKPPLELREEHRDE